MATLVPHQYKPFNHQIGGLPLIIYPVKNTGNLHVLVSDKDAIRRHLDALYEQHDDMIGRGVFQIVFIWAWRGLLMTDVWIQQPNTMVADVGGEIGIEKCVTFKGFEPYTPIGIASDNSAAVIGREQEYRWKFDALSEYLDRSAAMPDFPDGFAPTEEF